MLRCRSRYVNNVVAQSSRSALTVGGDCRAILDRRRTYGIPPRSRRLSTSSDSSATGNDEAEVALRCGATGETTFVVVEKSYGSRPL